MDGRDGISGGHTMAVVLRLSRAGTHKAPFYHVVATDSRKARDGRYLEDVGTYDPTTKPVKIQLKSERIEHWIKAGARPSQTVAMLIKRVKVGGAKVEKA
jgi:small subunit ribosomal protein S16